jgi:hypothetical protein
VAQHAWTCGALPSKPNETHPRLIGKSTRQCSRNHGPEMSGLHSQQQSLNALVILPLQHMDKHIMQQDVATRPSSTSSSSRIKLREHSTRGTRSAHKHASSCATHQCATRHVVRGVHGRVGRGDDGHQRSLVPLTPRVPHRKAHGWVVPLGHQVQRRRPRPRAREQLAKGRTAHGRVTTGHAWQRWVTRQHTKKQRNPKAMVQCQHTPSIELQCSVKPPSRD